MNSAPAFSVIMPTYNRASLLPTIVEAILKQSFSDFELIIVNDGSTDNTKEVLAALSDPRITVIHQENTRQTQARRSAGLSAKGIYLAFCDSDDIWAPTYLQSIFDIFENEGADYVFTNYQVQGEEGPRINIKKEATNNWLKAYSTMLEGELYKFSDLYSALIEYQPIFCSCQSVRKAHYDSIGGISEHINNLKLTKKITSEDSHIIRRSGLTKNAIFLNKKLVTLGRQGDNTSSSYISNLEGGLFILEDILMRAKLSSNQRVLTKKAIHAHKKDLCLQYYYHRSRDEFLTAYKEYFSLSLHWKSHFHALKTKLAN